MNGVSERTLSRYVSITHIDIIAIIAIITIIAIVATIAMIAITIVIIIFIINTQTERTTYCSNAQNPSFSYFLLHTIKCKTER